MRYPAIASALLLCACDATGALEAIEIEQVEQALGAPTGELERTDARGLAYRVYNARTVLRIVEVPSAEMPGIDRSPLFVPTDLEGCASDIPRGFEVDLPCLGHPSGQIRVQANSELANDNGGYSVQLQGASVEADLEVDGTFEMRVEGIANPVAIEKTTLAPVVVVDGMPRFFEALESAGIVIDNTRGQEAIYYVVVALGRSFVIQVDETESTPERLVYTVQDVKNMWTCTSALSGHEILGSSCRTPVGQGDFAQLEF